MTRESNLVEAGWVAGHLGDPSVVIIDCRFDLARPEAGIAEYGRAHIPGAFHLDLERDMSRPKQVHGGRHPLPDIEAFGRKLGSLGIDHRVTVVAYDAQNGCMAARLWWMLRYLGHPRARVLDGGWPAWLRGGGPTTADVRPAAPRAFVPRPDPDLIIGMEELRTRLRGGSVHLVDSRVRERYRGEVEPLDPVAGHIPGASNLPWADNLDGQGALKPPDELRERFSALGEGSRVIVYCGSGVTACANLLAMEETGETGAVLYLGGWSDWCSYPENPVARDD